MDEQAEEIMSDLEDYMANPQGYSQQDFEDIFQDRDPFEFLQEGPHGRADCYNQVTIASKYPSMSVGAVRISL